MKSDQERNVRIRQMREAGHSIRGIALALDLSMEAVEMVVHKFETDEVLSLRFSQFLENIRKVDDPDKKWKLNIIIEPLRFKTLTENALIFHFECRTLPEISPRTLMELAISETTPLKRSYVISPLLHNGTCND